MPAKGAAETGAASSSDRSDLFGWKRLFCKPLPPTTAFRWLMYRIHDQKGFRFSTANLLRFLTLRGLQKESVSLEKTPLTGRSLAFIKRKRRTVLYSLTARSLRFASWIFQGCSASIAGRIKPHDLHRVFEIGYFSLFANRGGLAYRGAIWPAVKKLQYKRKSKPTRSIARRC